MNIISETSKYTSTIELEHSLLILDPEVNNTNSGFDKTTILTINDYQNQTIRIRFDWCNYSATEDQIELLTISEADKLFFGARFFWGVIDLKDLKVCKQEKCTLFWNFERHNSSIVVITELEAFSLDINGKTIDRVPIDPPFNSKNFDDRIEFDFNGSKIKFYPYSGWATGKTIKDGRGLENLLKQLK